jgi:hypothetical protein
MWKDSSKTFLFNCNDRVLAQSLSRKVNQVIADHDVKLQAKAAQETLALAARPSTQLPPQPNQGNHTFSRPHVKASVPPHFIKNATKSVIEPCGQHCLHH